MILAVTPQDLNGGACSDGGAAIEVEGFIGIGRAPLSVVWPPHRLLAPSAVCSLGSHLSMNRRPFDCSVLFLFFVFFVVLFLYFVFPLSYVPGN